jgi:hypothetical protein
MPQENIYINTKENKTKNTFILFWIIYEYPGKEKEKRPTVEFSPCLLDIRCDSLSDLKIHQYAGHTVFAHVQRIEAVGTVSCEDEALGASLDGKVDDLPHFCPRSPWCIAQDNFAGGDVDRRFRVAAAQSSFKLHIAKNDSVVIINCSTNV